MSNTFPNNSVDSGPGQDVVNGVKEIWPQVLEKAVATLDGGYGAIANGGSPVVAMEQLTGQPATAISPTSVTASALQSGIAAGELFVLDTANKPGLPYSLVGDHAYMLEGLSAADGTAMVQLGNPWGPGSNPSLIPLASLAASSISEVDIGRFA